MTTLSPIQTARRGLVNVSQFPKVPREIREACMAAARNLFDEKPDLNQLIDGAMALRNASGFLSPKASRECRYMARDLDRIAEERSGT